MIPILDWIFEGIVNWVASVVSQLFDAVSGLFLEALGTDMTAMEEYFPFVTKAYDVMQVTAWAILILITIWQLFRAFGGPITEAENPWHLLVRSSVYGLLIGYDNGKLRTTNVETIRYKQTPTRFAEPEKRGDIERKPPKRKGERIPQHRAWWLDVQPHQFR